MSMMEQFKAQLTHLQTKLKSVPQTRYVSVLLDDKHQPAQLITFDPLDNYVLIQRLNDVKEGQEDSMQLWALDENDQPLSLGVITLASSRTTARHRQDPVAGQRFGGERREERRG